MHEKMHSTTKNRIATRGGDLEGWPRKVTRAGVTVKIYRITNRGRIAYQTAHYIGPRRCLKNFAAYADAKAHAEEQAALLMQGRLDVARMRDTDRESYVAATRLLQPLDVPLLDAVREYIAARKALPSGVSMQDAAKDYAKRHPANAPRKTVAEVVAEFLAAKAQDKKSYRYIKTLTTTLAPNADGDTVSKKRRSFGDAFRCCIADVQTSPMEQWLRGRDVAPRTRRNLVLMLRTLFNFAKGQGYLPKGLPTEADTLTLPKKSDGESIGIFTPEEMAKLMTGTKAHPANDEYRLWLALGGFSGLRTAEMLRLEWGKHIQPERGLIQVSADIAKANGRRIINLQPNLIAWLSSYAGKRGKAFEPRADERAHAYAERLGVEWKPNALRHSFISYLVAKSKNLPAVALEAGNSVAIINKHYRELVTEDAGKTWFSIMPDAPSNVVPMMAAKKARA